MCQCSGQLHGLRHIGHALRGASGAGQLGRLGKVEGVRPQHHGARAGSGLDQVLPAQRCKTAAQQGHVGQAVVQGHLAQGVAQEHIGLGVGAIGPLAAARHAQARALQQLGYLVKALGVARHDQPLHAGVCCGILRRICFIIDSW